MGLRVTIFSQQLCPLGSGVRYSQPPFSGSGKHMPCYTGSWCLRHKTVASLSVLQRSRSPQICIPSPSSAPSMSHKSMLAEAGPHSAPAALTLHSFLLHGCYFTTDHMASSSLLLQATWREKPLIFQPAFILNAWPRTSYVTTNLATSMMSDFYQFPVSFTFF